MDVLKRCWDFMSSGFSKMLNDFYHNESLDWRINTTLLALIPKKKDAYWIKDLRPINLVSCSYKLISKIPARRLKECLADLVGTSQGAFVKKAKS